MPTDRSTGQRPGGRSARVRRAVVDATLALLIERGLAAVTIPAVAERSGVHATSIYRRWGGRDALVADVLLTGADTAMPLPDTGSFRGDAIALLEDLRRLLASPLGAAFAEVVIASRADDNAELRRRYWTGRLAHVSVMVERAVARGELARDADPRFTFELLVGPLHTRALTAPDELGEDLPARIVDACLAGLATRS